MYKKYKMTSNISEIIIHYKDVNEINNNNDTNEHEYWKQYVCYSYEDDLIIDEDINKYFEEKECEDREREENELHQFYMDIANDYEEYEQLCREKEEKDLYQFLMIKNDDNYE